MAVEIQGACDPRFVSLRDVFKANFALQKLLPTLLR